MTLLSIVQGVVDETKLGTRPTSVIGNVEPDTQTMLRLANRLGNSLMKRYPWQVLRTETTFTSVATETQTAILPSDFDRIVPETFWNRTDSILINGPVSATRWQGLKAQSYGDTETPVFAYRGDAILVQPTLDAGKTLAFEYVSNLWCESSVGTGQSAWAADTDVAKLDEELFILGVKYLYLTDEGLPNASAGSDFVDYYNTLIDNDQPDMKILVAADIFGGGRHFTGEPPVSGSIDVL